MPLVYIKIKNSKNISVLALGPESAGNFSVFSKRRFYLSKDFGDLLENKNFAEFQKAVLDFLKKNKIKPNVVLTDLHPLYKTTAWGRELAKKFKAEHLQIQHHLAHIFSSIGEQFLEHNGKNNLLLKKNAIIGIACDGTGYGTDGNIWGGEVFKISRPKTQDSRLNFERIGHLENQILIGGDLGIKEPARMLVSILNKFLKKEEIYKFIKKYYSKNKFEVLFNQLQQNFNCQKTSSAGRVLDAVSVLLGFCGNKRNYKHEPVDLLEKNSTNPYQIKPLIRNNQLLTTYLFKYLVKNLNKDKKRLAASAQLYLAKGLYEIAKTSSPKSPIYFSGGMANNKIMSSYLSSKGCCMNTKIPRGDAGLSLGQIFYYLLANPRD